MGTENVKLGVANVFYNGVDLGLTKGGIEVQVTTDVFNVTVDQFGDSEINQYIRKRSIIVTVPMAETTLENLVSIMPGATLITDGVDPLIKRVDVTNGIGTDLLSISQELRLRPVGNLDASEDLTIGKAGTGGALSFAYKYDEERLFNVEFTGYPDANDILFSIGDPTATP